MEKVVSVVLCIGPERWLRQEAVAELKRGCLAAGFEETDFVRFSDPKTEPQAILEAARTAPFGSPRRLILVDGLEELTPESVPWLKNYLDPPNPKSCVVLCADKLEKEREFGRARIIRCLPLKGRPLEEWVAQRCRQKGKPIEIGAVSELVRRVGSGLQGLDLALDSLILMAGDSSRITLADVEALIAPSLQQTAFEILDAAASGQTDRAVLALREAMALGRMNRDQFLGALGWYLRMSWKGDGAMSWMPPERREALNRFRRWPASRFQDALEELLRTDVRIKQGHPSPEWLADRLLLKLR